MKRLKTTAGKVYVATMPYIALQLVGIQAVLEVAGLGGGDNIFVKDAPLLPEVEGKAEELGLDPRVVRHPEQDDDGDEE